MEAVKRIATKQKVNITSSIVIDFVVALLLFASKIFIQEYQIENDFLVKADGIISLFMLFLFVWQHYKISKNILNYNIIFILFIYLFTFGQILLYAFGVPVRELFIFRITDMADIYWASSFALRCFMFFQIGSLLPYYKNTENEQKVEGDCEKNNEGVFAAIRIVGILIFLVSVVPYFSSMAGKLDTSIKFGYGALYGGNESVLGVVDYLSKLFIPSIFLIMYSVRKKMIKKILKLILVSLAIMTLIMGVRGDALSIIVILIIYKYRFEKRMNIKNFVRVLLAALIIVITIPAVANFRRVADKDLTGFTDSVGAVFDESNNNFMVRTIAELGGSLHPIILTRQIIPSIQDYRYGESYVASAMMVFPSFLMGGYSFAPKAALDIWLQDTLNMTYGPGYSLFAETYYNFGRVFGILFSLVIGLFFSAVFNLGKGCGNSKNRILPILSLIFLYNSIIIARFPMHMTVRNTVYMYIIPYILIKVIYKRKYGKDEE